MPEIAEIEKRFVSEKALKNLIKNPAPIQRELNNRSFYSFLVWAWPQVSAHPFVDNWHIKYLCDILQEIAEGVGNRQPKKQDLLINIPPGTTKTIICSIVFPVWCWTKWHWLRFITASYSSALSLESADFSRDLIKSSLFQEVYPDIIIKMDKDSKGNYKIVKRVKSNISDYHYKELLGGYRYSTSVGGTLMGFHGDIIIWDDPINPQQTYSEIQLDIANRWIDQTLPTRKTNKNNSVVIGIMQRLHSNDPSGHILAKKKTNLKHICLPGEIVRYKNYVKPRSLIKYYSEDGLFDVNRMNWKVLRELEVDLGQYGYAGQIGQNPAPAGGGMFKVDHFHMTNEIFPPQEYVQTVRFWDKAASVTKKAAYTTGVKISKMKNGSFLIDDVKRGKWDSDEREKIIRSVAEADGRKVIVIIEQEPGSAGKESVLSTVRNLAGFIVKKDRPTGDKIHRADPFSVQVNEGNVLLRTATWNAAFKEEFSLFPFAPFKDQVDATSGGFNYLVRKKEVRRIT